jgi:hypothetical protein
MAIRRCPYCKAIIDESQKYCNNCGTQLLFPEDETAEEDIKGEKILDKDFSEGAGEESEVLLEPPAKEEAEAEAEAEEVDLEDVLKGERAFPGEEEARPSAAQDAGGLEEIGAEKEPAAAEDDIPEEAIIQSAEELLRSVPEPDLNLEGEEEGEGEEEARIAEDQLDFNAKGEIVQLIAELEKRRSEQESEGAAEARPTTASREELPPWAETFKGGEAAADVPGEESFAAGDTMDFKNEVMKRAGQPKAQSSTMGIPESVTKMADEIAVGDEPLGLEEAAAAEEEAGLDLGALEAEAEAQEEPEAAEAAKLGFGGHVEAFLFDLVFVAIFWFVAVGMAARMMRVGLISLVRAASLPVGLLFLALFAGYFFLFLFFLGETLGRRLAARRD